MRTSQSRVWELESKAQVLGTPGSNIFILAGLPKNARVVGFLLMADFDVTAAGATGARPADVAAKLYNLIEHQSEFLQLRATGQLLSVLYHHMHGRKLNNALGGNAISRYRVPVWIPLSDPRALEPLDTAIPTELLEGKTIEVKTSEVTAVQLFGAAAVATLNHRLFAMLADGVGPIDPAATRIDFEDWGGQTVRLKSGGVFSHLNIFKEPVGFADPAEVTPDAEITRVNFTYGGEQIVKSALTTAMVIEYNRQQVAGGFEDNDAEQISDTSVPFLPIFSPGVDYKIPTLPGGMEQSILELTGTLNSVRVGYRQVMHKNVQQVEAAQKKLLPNAATVSRNIKTSDKTPVGRDNSPDAIAKRSRYSTLLPGRLTEG